MLADLGYLEVLDGLVAAEISARLAEQPVLMSNVAALRALQRCISTRLAPCLALLAHAIEWHAIADANPRMSAKARAVLRLRLAKLYAMHGDIDRGVAAADDHDVSTHRQR